MFSYIKITKGATEVFRFYLHFRKLFPNQKTKFSFSFRRIVSESETYNLLIEFTQTLEFEANKK